MWSFCPRRVASAVPRANRQWVAHAFIVAIELPCCAVTRLSPVDVESLLYEQRICPLSFVRSRMCCS